jgi:hypothetical protein
MNKALIMLVLLFVVGVGALAPTQAQSDRRNPCARRCHQESRSERERCHNLPPGERRDCERRIKERIEACLRNCR